MLDVRRELEQALSHETPTMETPPPCIAAKSLPLSDILHIAVPLGIYRHYKSNQYEVIGFAKCSETLADMVVYKALYGEQGTWVRPLSMWSKLVEIDGKSVKRFEYVVDSEQKP